MREVWKKECPTLLLVAIMIFSQNVYAFSQVATGGWRTARDIAQLLILLILIVNLLRKTTINLKVLCAYLVFIGCMLITMFLLSDFAGSYWILDCTIAFLFVELYDEQSIAEKFEKIMFVICSIYTILYVIAMLYTDILKTKICLYLEQVHLIWYHSSAYEYYVNGIVPIRSYAIFREPGIYQMFIILAMIIELFTEKKIRWWHMVVYTISLLATHSTTGYICLIMVIILFIVKYVKCNRLTILCGSLAVIAAIPVLPKLLNSILAKFTATGGSSHSWLSRKASILVNLYFWKEKPIIGVGISNIFQYFNTVALNVFGLHAGAYSITDDTNTILLFFAAFGLVCGSIFVIGTYGWCMRVTQNKLLSLGVLVILIFLYAGEAVNSTCYPYILLFIGISYIVDRKTVKKIKRESNDFDNYSVL